MTTKLTEAQLLALQARYPNNKQHHAEDEHLFKDITPWTRCSWQVVERGPSDYVAAYDNSQGLIAVFKGDELLASGLETLVTNECVMLNQRCWSCAKWLWF